jgi:hypothetical protein
MAEVQRIVLEAAREYLGKDGKAGRDGKDGREGRWVQEPADPDSRS